MEQFPNDRNEDKRSVYDLMNNDENLTRIDLPDSFNQPYQFFTFLNFFKDLQTANKLISGQVFYQNLEKGTCKHN